MVIRNLNRDRQRGHGEDGRFYYWKDEAARISVTNAISKGIPKPALLGWAKKQTAIGAIEMHQKIDDLLKDEELTWNAKTGKPTSTGGAAAYSLLWNYADSKRDAAADTGTMVHDLLESYALGEDPPIPADPTVRAMYEQGIDFLKVTSPEIVAAEAIVYNRRYNYAGTLDAIMLFDHPQLPGHTMVDYKTGKGVYSEAALQLTALAYCEFIGMDDGTEIELPPIDNGVVVHIRPDKWEVIPVRLDAKVFQRFVGALHTAEWQLRDAKQALGRPLNWGK